MKPEENTCIYCNKQLDGNRNKKFCSDAHKQAFYRDSVTVNSNTVTKQEQTVTTEQGSSVENHGEIQNLITVTKLKPISAKPTDCGINFELSETDLTFFKRALKDFKKPYYNFTDQQNKQKCIQCGKQFITGLPLLRYCSYQHYSKALTVRRVR